MVKIYLFRNIILCKMVELSLVVMYMGTIEGSEEFLRCYKIILEKG